MNLPTGSPRAAIRAKKSARFITATTRRRFRCAGNCRRRASRRSSSCTARLTRIISAQIAFDAVKFVAAKKPETIFRFVGKRTAGLEKFLQRAQTIPHFKFEATGFTPYAEVSNQLASATVGIVPYEESAGTHCAFVAKIVEYVATGLPTVCTPLKSVQSYFKIDPLVKFSKFDGEDFGEKILSWLDEPVSGWQPHAAQSAARVKTELDWQPLCRKAVDFVERIFDAKV